MAKGTKNVNVTITASDRTAAGVNSAKKRISGAASNMRQMNLVSKDAGMAMSQFNEKTEKGRQVLTAFGGAVGGAAGNVVYYTGTLTYMLGRFNLLEIAVMAGVAAIGALAWAFTSSSAEADAWGKTLDDAKKSTDNLVESINDWIESEKQQREGWTKYEKRLKKVNDELDTYYGAMMGITEKLRENATAIEQLNNEYDSDLVHQYVRAWFAFGDIAITKARLLKEEQKGLNDGMKKAMEQQKEADEEEKKKKGRGPSGPSVLFPGGGGFFNLARRTREEFAGIGDKIVEDLERSGQEQVSLEERRRSLIIQADRQYYDARARLDEEYRRQQHQRTVSAIKQNIRDEQARQKVIENSIGMFEALGTAVAQSEEQQAAVRIASIIARAVPKVIEETAEGFGALGNFNFWSAAQHFTSAGLYASLAGMNAAETARGASGGGAGYAGGTAGGSESMRTSPPSEHTQTIIVELGGREVGRTIVDISDAEQRRRNPQQRRQEWS